METAKLKKFAQFARRRLIEQVGNQLKLVLAADSPERRESPQTITALEKQIAVSNQEQLIEKAAYIWFNRFCALRFMDVNRYNRSGVISPVEGQFQPEILAEAKAGHIDEALITGKKREQVFSLLSGSAPSRDPQTEAYRALIVAVCNDYHRLMPYLFERIDDYIKLLMPDDLLSGNSILAYTREAMTPEACESVEVIGWLYQFYISEKKDQIFEGLKKNKKITPENIPAATQLFTPHWIVRYLVENSLGRLWLLNKPNSKVIERMDYYIAPAEAEVDFLRISSPEELKICDPACGSGHILTYAYDLLYAIYQDAGYEEADIPELILSNNLYGIEIDERAAGLAAFALSMKAMKGNPFDNSNNRRRFFNKPIEPNICKLEKIQFSNDELDSYMDFVGGDLFTQDLRATLEDFEEADNFGSLIQPSLTSVNDVLATLHAKDVSGQLFLAQTHKDVIKVLQQTDYLSPKYHVVIANPPYMGGKGMNGRLATWLKDNYPDVKSDLFSAFIVRNTAMTLAKGQLGFMSPFVWMFISSYEKLRSYLINQKTFTSLIQLEYSGFDGATVPICTFTLENAHNPEFQGGYVRLSDFKGANNQAPKTLEAIKNPDCGWFHRASATDFRKIPGSPIAYWVSEEVFSLLDKSQKLGDVADARMGMATGNNAKYVRCWHEVSTNNIGFEMENRESAKQSESRWFPYSKGGIYRKWYGNNEYVVDWFNDGNELQTALHPDGKRIWAHNFNLDHIFDDSVTWSDITSGKLSVRWNSKGFLFDGSGTCAFFENKDQKMGVLGFLNTPFANDFSKVLNPTLHFQTGDFRSMPLPRSIDNVSFVAKVRELVELHKLDWDSKEQSWDFQRLELLSNQSGVGRLTDIYFQIREKWKLKLKISIEKEIDNYDLFLKSSGCNIDLNPEISLGEITLYCNPHYRYGGDKSEEELEALLFADTIREFISYAVGCMVGRYSLDQEGLILANQGDTLEDYLKQVPNPSFEPDDDNIIPLIDFDGDWFPDDITERFQRFLQVTFGADNLQDNLATIENALGKDIRRYFVRDFYTDHVKRYKKRPIYWLFSSPKGSFNALIYMHRYRPGTVSIVLNDYLREFRTKLTARKQSFEQVGISASTSQKEKTQAIKTLEKINKVLDEINEYEHHILYPLATQKIEIDLDDGVKHNYPLFGKALKKVAGLS